MARVEYEMTEEDLAELKNAFRPIPLVAIHTGMPRSQQERANDAWQKLGDKMSFQHMTVKPSGQGDRFFTAEAKDNGDG